MKVWDGFVRFFHWALVACLAGLYVSAEQGLMELHFVLGYTTTALLVTRLVWGVFGSDTARLSALLNGPKAVVQALRSSDVNAGHNAAGGYMVLLFFVLVLVQVTTGFMTTDDILTDGPLVQYVPYAWVEWASSWHKQNFDLLLIAIGLHIAAIVFYALRGKKLVPAMVTGRNSQINQKVVIKPSWPAFVIFVAIFALIMFTWGYQPFIALF
ncbi:cytochrome b/b6 domain-containing protein [Pseudoalteromonas sp. SSDWG2]|uniref:cytochrome b/b6 domain-containing protein n=1 Tax=Pseudoalteromonas sp. SSDWG2 TaxID=3139391 RepID=UPI003BA9EAB0